MQEEVKLLRPHASAWAQDTRAKFVVTFSPHLAELAFSRPSVFPCFCFSGVSADDFSCEKSSASYAVPGDSPKSGLPFCRVSAAFHIVKRAGKIFDFTSTFPRRSYPVPLKKALLTAESCWK